MNPESRRFSGDIFPRGRPWMGGIGVLLLLSGCSGTGAPPPPETANHSAAPVRMVKGPPLAADLAPEPPNQTRTPPPPAGKATSYAVRPGDTLWAIATAHNIDVEQLATWNRITNPDQLTVGQRLRVIPPGTEPFPAARPVSSWPPPPDTATSDDKTESSNKPAPSDKTESSNKPAPSDSAEAASKPDSRPPPLPGKPGPRLWDDPPGTIPPPSLALRDPPPRPDPTPDQEDTLGSAPAQARPLSPNAPAYWVWPHPGRVIGRFGQVGALRNTGIDIAAKPGDPVLAAADGMVAYADQGLSTFGNMVLLRHGGSFMTAYAHLQKIMVKKGQNVRAGETIALAGQSGVTVSPRLHFEIRRSIAPQNPLQYLPKRD
ncbi:MAG: M23 family metallopeptidase [Magnetococcales bacterium]|nr:M23 family metallopeptidase [Magnetococcales bacterium]